MGSIPDTDVEFVPATEPATQPNTAEKAKQNSMLAAYSARFAPDHPAKAVLCSAIVAGHMSRMSVEQYTTQCNQFINQFRAQVEFLRIHKIFVPAGPTITEDMTLRQVNDLCNRYAGAEPVLGGYVVTFEHDGKIYCGACEIDYESRRRGLMRKNRAIWTAIRFAVAVPPTPAGADKVKHVSKSADVVARRIPRRYWSHRGQLSEVADMIRKDSVANDKARAQRKAEDEKAKAAADNTCCSEKDAAAANTGCCSVAQHSAQ